MFNFRTDFLIFFLFIPGNYPPSRRCCSRHYKKSQKLISDCRWRTRSFCGNYTMASLPETPPAFLAPPSHPDDLHTQTTFVYAPQNCNRHFPLQDCTLYTDLPYSLFPEMNRNLTDSMLHTCTSTLFC